MSLTSYRAAPPRVKHLLCLQLDPGDGRLRPALFAWLFSSVPKASLEGNPGQSPSGAGRMYQGGVPLERAAGTFFFDFMTGNRPISAAFPAHLPEVPQRASLRQQDEGRNAPSRRERRGQTPDERPAGSAGGCLPRGRGTSRRPALPSGWRGCVAQARNPSISFDSGEHGFRVRDFIAPRNDDKRGKHQ